jgi:hypothetical protein
VVWSVVSAHYPARNSAREVPHYSTPSPLPHWHSFPSLPSLLLFLLPCERGPISFLSCVFSHLPFITFLPCSFFFPFILSFLLPFIPFSFSLPSLPSFLFFQSFFKFFSFLFPLPSVSTTSFFHFSFPSFLYSFFLSFFTFTLSFSFYFFCYSFTVLLLLYLLFPLSLFTAFPTYPCILFFSNPFI